MCLRTCTQVKYANQDYNAQTKKQVGAGRRISFKFETVNKIRLQKWNYDFNFVIGNNLYNKR